MLVYVIIRALSVFEHCPKHNAASDTVTVHSHFVHGCVSIYYGGNGQSEFFAWPMLVKFFWSSNVMCFIYH